MAVMAIYRRDDVPAELYDEMRRRAPVDQAPVGVLTHAYARQGANLVVVDVWEDEDAMRRYISERLKPVIEGLNVRFEMPEIIPIVAIFTSPAAAAYERPFETGSVPA